MWCSELIYLRSSLDYKEEYDQAAAELEKATEMSVNQNSRRKGVNGEIKQYKEMKKEADRYRSLAEEKVRSTPHFKLTAL